VPEGSKLKQPLDISKVNKTNLVAALESVRGCLKTTSMLWMKTLGLPVLDGIVVADWSRGSAVAVKNFSKARSLSRFLLRIDKRHDRWTLRRGGYLVSLEEVPSVVKELQREGMLAVLLEPASPYADQYSLAGVTIPQSNKMIIEVVGSGFDASDMLRGDLQSHERWESSLEQGMAAAAGHPSVRRLSTVTSEEYARSVQRRLAKIGARAESPAFPDILLKSTNRSESELAQAGINYLRSTKQPALLKHAEEYSRIPEQNVVTFVKLVQKLLSGLSAYGIHLGSSSFAASIVQKRGLVFWDFFPARKQEADALYPPG
jgi:hypothetical protein